MSRQFWSEAIVWATASGTAIANSTTEAIIFPNVTIPGNYMQDGRVLRINAWGQWCTTSGPNLSFGLRWGGATSTPILGKSAIVVTFSSTGGAPSMTALFRLEAFIQTRSNGATGSLFTDGEVTLWSSTTPTAVTSTTYGMSFPIASGSTGGTTPVAVTADLTGDMPLAVTALWGTASASNSIQGNIYTVESLN